MLQKILLEKYLKMDVIKSVQLYFNKIVEECGPGMKILLMDKETVSKKDKRTPKPLK